MYKEKQDFNEYDDKIIDIDEISGQDIKINPDYYIHSALLKAQQALVKDNTKEGFMQFRIIVEHIEGLCRAAGRLTEEYEKEIKKYAKDLDKKEGDIVNYTKIANKKLELIMYNVFKTKTLIAPLKG